MSDTKFTPGPWTRSKSKESGGSFIEHIDSDYVGHLVAFVHASHGMFEPLATTQEDEANANLIAAAPELYEAMENLVAVSGSVDWEVIEPKVMACRSAMKKARGES